MQFPHRELEVVQLANDMSRGLAANADVFPAPPTTAQAIDEALAAYNTAREASVAAQGRAKARTRAKKKALTDLAGMLRSGVKYAESVANKDTSKLRLVGWGGHRRGARNPEPGPATRLEVRKEGDGWVVLTWNPPTDGGPVSAYRIQRRKRDGGAWTDVGSSVDTTTKLDAQDTGVELEYQVLGLNAAGEGPASNIVRVVL
ncbi:MAG: fibronectin type III domain-containing protein [Gemmatimonadales bacterium]